MSFASYLNRQSANYAVDFYKNIEPEYFILHPDLGMVDRISRLVG